VLYQCDKRNQPHFIFGDSTLKKHTRLILSPFLENLIGEEKDYGFLQQDGANTHRGNKATGGLRNSFVDRKCVVVCGLLVEYHLWRCSEETVNRVLPELCT
jgi:hypothetical protein